MLRKRFANNKGVALLVTITVITLIIASALAWNQKVRSTVTITAINRDRLTLSYMAAAGIHAAMAMLVKDKMQSTSDSLQEDWANPEEINKVLQDIPFEDGSVTFKINDELGKIQINALVQYPSGHNFNDAQYGLWDRFLRSLPAQDTYQEDTDPTAIINSVKDWLDSNDDDAITGLSGAESGYYQDLDPPYACRNGPFNHIGELALVKGVTPDLFQVALETADISEYMTVYGITNAAEGKFTYEGRININTAGLMVLSALLPSESQDIAAAIYDYRQETQDLEFIHDLSDPKWYQNVPGTGGIEIDPNLLTTSSDIFSIESTATLHDLKLTVATVVQREQDKKSGRWRCRVLKWQIK
ncbi:general secretion pathway protein GspK [Thermodesulfobacteriota bacterium]